MVSTGQPIDRSVDNSGLTAKQVEDSEGKVVLRLQGRFQR